MKDLESRFQLNSLCCRVLRLNKLCYIWCKTTKKKIFLFLFVLHWFSLFPLAGINLCSNNNGDCSQLCLPTSHTTRACMCTAGYSLKTGQQSCEGKTPLHRHSHTYSRNAVNKTVLSCLWAGMGSFLLYSVHEGIRGIPLDPADKSDALVPVSGTSLAVGIDFHAGEWHWETSVTRWPCLSDILKLSLSRGSEYL